LKINYPDNEEFFALPFYVDSRVLVPRNDTETMIYQVLKEINSADFTLIDV
jgi:methylase of polypeptide subunit release factors